MLISSLSDWRAHSECSWTFLPKTKLKQIPDFSIFGFIIATLLRIEPEIKSSRVTAFSLPYSQLNQGTFQKSMWFKTPST